MRATTGEHLDGEGVQAPAVVRLGVCKFGALLFGCLFPVALGDTSQKRQIPASSEVKACAQVNDCFDYCRLSAMLRYDTLSAPLESADTVILPEIAPWSDPIALESGYGQSALQDLIDVAS